MALFLEFDTDQTIQDHTQEPLEDFVDRKVSEMTSRKNKTSAEKYSDKNQ